MAIPAWTYSRLESFETCPRKFYHTKVAKDVPDPPTVYTEWGSKVHTALEQYVIDGTPLPEGMTQWEPLMTKIAALPGEKFPERQYALDRGFQPADWDNAWTRGIGDLVVIHGDKAVILDYKTGRRKPSEQLELYAGYVFAHHPQVTNVTTGFVWLKEKKLDQAHFAREDVPSIWQGFLPRVSRLESAYERDSWPARPSGLCRNYCSVLTCEFNGRREHNDDS